MEDATPTPDADTPPRGQTSRGASGQSSGSSPGTTVGEMIIARPRAPAEFDLQSEFSPAGDQPT
ncbi:MAG: hypothetical protein CNE93_06705, partial [SAR116 cluster bacterium MED-G06]